MNSVAIGRWDSKKRAEVYDWLLKYYGGLSKNTWYIDYDYAYERGDNLILNDEICIMFILRWS
jgi:hypothetical protein